VDSSFNLREFQTGAKQVRSLIALSATKADPLMLRSSLGRYHHHIVKQMEAGFVASVSDKQGIG